MRFFRNQSRTPIGLDIGTRHVKAAQLERAHGPYEWRLAAAARFPRASPHGPLDPAEFAAIADGLDRHGFAGNQIVVPVPADQLLGGALEVPARTADVPIAQIARMELARTQRCAPDSFEMGLWDLPAPARAKSATQIMTVGCAHAQAELLLDAYESQGFDVVALDVRSSALARAASPVVRSDAAISVILDLGWDAAMLVMLCAGAVVYCRALADAGTRSLHESLHQNLGLDSEVTDYLLSQVGLDSRSADDPAAVELPEGARKLLISFVDLMVQELKASFSYVSQEYLQAPLTRLLLSGSGAAIPGLCGHMSGVLAVETRMIAPPALVDCPPSLPAAGLSPALTAAVGLAQFQEAA